MESIKVLVEQMEKATNEKKTVVMLGDMNINAERWRDEKSKNKKVANEVLGALEACGLKHMKLGCTFLADNTAQRGRTVESTFTTSSHAIFKSEEGGVVGYNINIRLMYYPKLLLKSPYVSSKQDVVSN